MKTLEEIKEITENIIADTDLFLVDLKVSADNCIEIIVDAKEGVNIDTCSELCTRIEPLLDRENGDFELTVSSAGIGYPFKVAEQYQKNLGNKVEILLKTGSKKVGTLLTFDGEKISVELEERIRLEGKKRPENVKTAYEFQLSEVKQIKDIVIF